MILLCITKTQIIVKFLSKKHLFRGNGKHLSGGSVWKLREMSKYESKSSSILLFLIPCFNLVCGPRRPYISPSKEYADIELSLTCGCVFEKVVQGTWRGVHGSHQQGCPGVPCRYAGDDAVGVAGLDSPHCQGPAFLPVALCWIAPLFSLTSSIVAIFKSF